MINKPNVVRKHRSDEEVRRRKAAKILSILRSHLGSDHLGRLKCLDLGCSIGIISGELAEIFREVVGLDLDEKALARARGQNSQNVAILKADGTQLPFKDEAFDVVICAQVYEHVGNPARLFREIYRVLKEEGTCFFSGPNKLAPIEEHYSLPFVHWLPRPLADSYLRIFGKAESYAEAPLLYWELRKLAIDFEVIDYTSKMIRDPGAFYCEDEVRPGWLRMIPDPVLQKLIFAFPNYNWILKKKLVSRQG